MGLETPKLTHVCGRLFRGEEINPYSLGVRKHFRTRVVASHPETQNTQVLYSHAKVRNGKLFRFTQVDTMGAGTRDAGSKLVHYRLFRSTASSDIPAPSGEFRASFGDAKTSIR